MGILELLDEEQNPIRAIEHVRKSCVNRDVFKEVLNKVFEVLKPLRVAVQGELEIEGVFHPTTKAHVVRLDLRISHPVCETEAIILGHASLYLGINDKQEVMGLIAYNVTHSKNNLA